MGNFDTAITDEGMKNLGELKELRQLTIAAPNISDKGLLALRRLSRLRELTINNCPGVTDSAIDCLMEALPECNITIERRGTRR